MTMRVKGTFEVSLDPQPASAGLGRFRLEKRYAGVLGGTGQGEMLSWQQDDGATAVYVAVERVTGSLNGLRGSFVLTHRGTMRGAEQALDIAVVPGSGTEELAGLRGTMDIEIVDGQHYYELEYELP